MQYKFSDLQAAIWDPLVDDAISNILTVQNILNEIVREVNGEMDLRSLKRRVASSPNLYSEEYDYYCPSDVKANKIVDIIPQLPRWRGMDWNLVSEEEFDRRKSFEKYLVCFSDHDGVRKLRVAAPYGQDLFDFTLDPLSSTTTDGAWITLGDATNIRNDNINYVQPPGSIEFDIGTGGTGIAGIQNTTKAIFDLTNYITQGSIFVWAYIPSSAILAQITNLELKIGQNTSAYWDKTATSDNAQNAFAVGWNLLRFDLSTSTKVGSPDATQCSYAALIVNSSAAITSVANWRFNMMRAQVGRFYSLLYYSKFGWQTSAGVYIENSTVSTDLLNADTDEFELYKLKGMMRKARIEKQWDEYKIVQLEYQTKQKAYLMNYPSDALLMTQTRYDFMKDISIENRNEQTEGSSDFPNTY